jgi:hypothetical protein
MERVLIYWATRTGAVVKREDVTPVYILPGNTLAPSAFECH